MKDAIRCDVCGRFVSYDDLDTGRATRKMLTPDSAYSIEEWETLCATHSNTKDSVNADL